MTIVGQLPKTFFLPLFAGHEVCVTVSLCGLRMPNTLAGIDIANQERVCFVDLSIWLQNLHTKPPVLQALSAVLGYVLLLLDLLSAYMGAPIMHEGSFQVHLICNSCTCL
jgi:hypothetical protein